VSGKLVFRELCRSIPCPPGRPRPHRIDLAERYLDQRPDPPGEIATLIDHIRARAARERSR
jgi:hypothetical protein